MPMSVGGGCWGCQGQGNHKLAHAKLYNGVSFLAWRNSVQILFQFLNFEMCSNCDRKVVLFGEGISMRCFYALAAATLLLGCAEQELTKQEKIILKKPVWENKTDFNQLTGSMKDAAGLANMMSGAYFNAAQNSARLQDLAVAGLIVTAGSVVAGGIGNTSDVALANRSVAAVGTQQLASRGVSKATIQSIYKGSKALNCVGTIATIYRNNLKNPEIGAEVTFGVIREIRISVRSSIARDVDAFASYLTAFRDGLPDSAASQATKRVTVDNTAEVGIEEYLVRLAGCLENESLKDNTDT
ncbi:hypothetical protein [uncultured Litoreibacter sp.]|uniref:hypothetical protein n=1 Tax=uncultured Litoreibacter sp. TaxID=1392394 RepID=UPI002628C9C3|nr:hypothetical protein [uncultured Litoreibacter sp.]